MRLCVLLIAGLVLLAGCPAQDQKTSSTAPKTAPAPTTETPASAPAPAPAPPPATETPATPATAPASGAVIPPIIEPDFSQATAYNISRIVDGDTIVVEHPEFKDLYTVRLIGVDTPETKHPNKPVEELGLEASAFTSKLLDGQKVYLEPDQGTTFENDSYGRVLAHVWRTDKLYINLEIVKQGYSYAYLKYPFRQDRMDVFSAWADVAREKGLGLWGLEEQEKAAPASGGEIMVYAVGEGTKYHRATCQFVQGKSGVTELTLEAAKNANLEPCKVCNPPG